MLGGECHWCVWVWRHGWVCAHRAVGAFTWLSVCVQGCMSTREWVCAHVGGGGAHGWMLECQHAGRAHRCVRAPWRWVHTGGVCEGVAGCTPECVHTGGRSRVCAVQMQAGAAAPLPRGSRLLLPKLPLFHPPAPRLPATSSAPSSAGGPSAPALCPARGSALPRGRVPPASPPRRGAPGEGTGSAGRAGAATAGRGRPWFVSVWGMTHLWHMWHC